MKCPFCPEGRMLEIEVDGVQLDRCGPCGALFFEVGELAAHTGNHALERRAREAASSMRPTRESAGCWTT